MRILQLRPCCGVACSVEQIPPRPGGQVDDMTTASLANAKAQLCFYPREVMRTAIRRLKFFCRPFTDEHGGRWIGLVLYARLTNNFVCVFGLVEKDFAPAVLSIGTLDLVTQMNFATRHGFTGPVPVSRCDRLKRVEHVAVLRNRLGAFDTFLRRGWKMPSA